MSVQTRAQRLKEEQQNRRESIGSQSPKSLNVSFNGFDYSPKAQYSPSNGHDRLRRNRSNSRSVSIESNQSNSSLLNKFNMSYDTTYYSPNASKETNIVNDKTITEDSDTESDNSIDIEVNNKKPFEEKIVFKTPAPKWDKKTTTSVNTRRANSIIKEHLKQNQMIYIAISLIFAHLSGFLSGCYYSTSTDEKMIVESPENLVSLHDRLKEEFPNQIKSFYSHLMSCHEHSIVNGKAPSIIMLVYDKKTAKSSKCIAKNILRTIHNQQNGINHRNLIVDGAQYYGKDHNEAKEGLDTELVNIFSNYKAKIALVQDIQQIPAKSMLLFHSYGDDDEQFSRYNGIIILLAYQLKEVISDDKEKMNELLTSNSKLTSFVEENLNKDWESVIDYDQLRPLYTRITNNVIFLNKEENCE